MAKIDRFNGDYKAFGSNATGTERTVFGEVTQDDSLTANITTEFLRGWGVVDENGFPPRNWFNAIAYTVSQTLAYLHQMGIAEWNTSQEYHLGSAVIDGSGKIYLSKINTNTGNALPVDEDANWKRMLDITDLVSPAFTGTPTAPTASSGDNSTQISTTAFVNENTKTRWQRKNLTSNSTVSGVISALTFTGLTIGKTYKVNLKAWISLTESSMSVQIIHDSNIISALAFQAADNSGSVNSSGIMSASDVVVFTATGTTIEFSQSAGAANIFVAGNADGWFTHAILEELPNHEEVSIW